jgi:energy-converting hydrogenase Eha subunit E
MLTQVKEAVLLAGAAIVVIGALGGCDRRRGDLVRMIEP